MPFPITNVMSSYSSVDYRNSVRVEGSGKVTEFTDESGPLGASCGFYFIKIKFYQPQCLLNGKGINP